MRFLLVVGTFSSLKATILCVGSAIAGPSENWLTSASVEQLTACFERRVDDISRCLLFLS